MTDDRSGRFSRKVTIVSFLLSVFIMYIHTNKLANIGEQGTPVYVLNKILAGTFGQVGVPFFFLQSGYWMFRFDIFEEKTDILKRKLRKKVTSIGVPFLLWNTFGLLFFLMATRLPVIRTMINGGEIVPITLRNIFGGIFLHQYNIVFWFMQDLIVVTALSPLLYRLLRHRWLTYSTILALTLLTVLGINSPVFQTSSILMFLTGGTLAVYHGEYWETFCGNYWELTFYLVLFLVFAAFRWISIPVLSTISVLVSPILFWKAIDFLTLVKAFDREPPWFCYQSFFIYAAHVFPVEALCTFLVIISSNMVAVTISYLLTPLVVLACLYVAAKVLFRWFPKVYQLLCGGRS